MFLTLCGVAFLVPLYATAGGGLSGWARFTMANIPFQPSAYELWAPVIFAYIFSAYYCRLMQKEYINFMQRRVQYLRAVDSDTPTQTYYTIMVERVPAVLRSHQSLTAFFDKLFPLQVHSVEIALDLNELDSLAATRRQVRNRLERAIAYWRATNQRPKVWLSKRFVEQQYCLRYMEAERSIRPVEDHWLARLFGYLIYDEIEHLWFLLDILNDSVTDLQQAYFQTQESGTSETDRNVTEGRLTKEATNVMNFVKGRMKSAQSTNFNFKYISSASSNLSAYMSSKLGFTPQITSTPAEERKSTDRLLEHDFLLPLQLAPEEEFSPPVSLDGVALASSSRLYLTPRSYNSVNSSNQGHFATQDPSATSYQRSLLQASGESSDTGTSSVQNELAFGSTVGPLRASSNSYQSDNRSRSNSSQSLRQEIGKQMTSLRDRIVESGVIKEAKVATSGALRGMMAATRTLELITFGAYYQTSSTAFVTLRSRVAAACAHQMLLSHENYSMTVLSAPNPRDIIWDNVSTPRTQIELRKSIASYTLVIGAIFWSIVVGFITTVSNLESLAQRYHWIKVYQNTFVYEFLNNYLALGLLLVLLALLPLLFDAVARRYEGLKLESEIQNSIMSRMFYYQLANVFVGLGIGSISSSINQILSTPSSILSILGGSLPSFSIYFATLLATKTLTGIPVEMLRSWSLLQVLGVKLCWNKKKLTRRELKMGALADSAAMYGWMYPNILMVLMILFVYSTIAPLVTPFALLYFSLAYLMYKYQLLYVYVNEYQSGGYMWYAVFNRSMVSLLLGVLVLLCYLTIRKTFSTGPMYLLLPLPIFIALFWQRCNNRYKFPSLVRILLFMY